MKILKNIFLFILVLVVIALIVALFVKKDYTVQREITINKPKDSVFNYIKYLKNQNDYSKWALMDPNMKKTFTGTDAAPGFISAWEGNKEVGKGAQEIKKITEGQKIETEIRFEKPFKSVASSLMSTETAGADQTKVTWSFTGKMPYPFNIVRLFMSMDKMIGADLQTGLDNLKKIQEKQ